MNEMSHIVPENACDTFLETSHILIDFSWKDIS